MDRHSQHSVLRGVWTSLHKHYVNFAKLFVTQWNFALQLINSLGQMFPHSVPLWTRAWLFGLWRHSQCSSHPHALQTRDSQYSSHELASFWLTQDWSWFSVEKNLLSNSKYMYYFHWMMECIKLDQLKLLRILAMDDPFNCSKMAIHVLVFKLPKPMISYFFLIWHNSNLKIPSKNSVPDHVSHLFISQIISVIIGWNWSVNIHYNKAVFLD